MVKVYRSIGTTALAALLAFGAVPGASAKNLADVNATSAGVEWNLEGNHESAVLTISGPGGGVMRQEFTGGETPSLSLFDASGERLPDGSYTWELRVAPVLGKADKDKLKSSRSSGSDAAWNELRASGKLPETSVQSGTFQIIGGAVVAGGGEETRGAKKSGLSSAKSSAVTHIAEADQVIPDDLIVQSSLCVGFDCVDGESFGFDTIRLKENNTRIKFEDTSTGTFPTTDWQLTANDSASGGANKFSIEDVTSAKVPFTITGGASTNSIFVDSTGRVGFRTATPVLDLHVATSNTPAMRLEQNNSGGFTAQTWDVAGNEANFFVRDVTGGSRLPFRIRPGAPTSSIDIDAAGDVGFGTASPSAPLHISRSTGAFLESILVQNNNEARISIQNTALTGTPKYFIAVNNTGTGTFLISRDGTGGAEVEVRERLDAGGNATMKVDGSVQATNVTFTSSRAMKEDFKELDPKTVLSKVAALPVLEWRFKEGPSDVRHIGPTAEDFHSAFQLSPNDKTISVTDTSGVALAAIQGLLQNIEELRKQNAELTERLQSLEQRLSEQQ